MKIISLLMITIFTLSCVRHSEFKVSVKKTNNQCNVTVKYAKGFKVELIGDSLTKITTNSANSNFNFKDSIYIINEPLNTTFNQKTIKNNYKALALQSSTYLAYLDVLNQLKLVKGLSGVSYVNNSKYLELIQSKQINEISNAGKIQLEPLLKINPDLFLIFPFELETANKYNDKGINTLIISEYLEQTPLARLEWIKLFGLMFNDYKKANDYFKNIEKKYLTQIIKIDTLNTVFFNLPFNNTWNMPASNSITANLIKDAGLNYIYKNNGNDNIKLSKEEVWNKVIDAKYWVIIASRPSGFSLADLLNEEEIYKEFKAVKQKNVLFCNTSTTNYFTDGIVNPHLMLKSLILAIQNKPTKHLNYFNRLK